MGEWNFVLVPPLSAFLFAFGGRKWKFMRRYVLPTVIGLAGLIARENIILVITAMVLLSISLHLGYGDSSWLARKLGTVPRAFLLTGALYGAPSALFGVWYGFLVTGFVFYTFGWLSRKFNKLTWAFVEATIGFSIGVVYSFNFI